MYICMVVVLVRNKKETFQRQNSPKLTHNSNGRAENKLVTERADAGGGGGGGSAGLDMDEEIVEV